MGVMCCAYVFLRGDGGMGKVAWYFVGELVGMGGNRRIREENRKGMGKRFGKGKGKGKGKGIWVRKDIGHKGRNTGWDTDMWDIYRLYLGHGINGRKEVIALLFFHIFVTVHISSVLRGCSFPLLHGSISLFLLEERRRKRDTVVVVVWKSDLCGRNNVCGDVDIGLGDRNTSPYSPSPFLFPLW